FSYGDLQTQQARGPRWAEGSDLSPERDDLVGRAQALVECLFEECQARKVRVCEIDAAERCGRTLPVGAPDEARDGAHHGVAPAEHVEALDEGLEPAVR